MTIFPVDSDKLKCIDATKLDYEENFFNYTYSIGSLEHFTDDGIDRVIEKLHYVTSVASFHMMPVSNKNKNIFIHTASIDYIII